MSGSSGYIPKARASIKCVRTSLCGSEELSYASAADVTPRKRGRRSEGAGLLLRAEPML